MQEYVINLKNLSLEKRDELGKRLFELGETPFENHLYNDNGPHCGRVYGNSSTVNALLFEGWDVSLAWEKEISG
jgi:hypothetical protein